jgi:hypothetical protein
MRLNHPNDELGGMLLMCFPQEIVHELDSWSPLMPPPSWGSANGVYHWHPPALAHARIRTDCQPTLLSSDPTEDDYDPDLYCSWPGISRRSASEEPGGIWRKKTLRSTALSSSTTTGTPPLPRHGHHHHHHHHRKKKVSLGITPHVERGKSRQNYFEMFRTIAETQFTHSPSPSVIGAHGPHSAGENNPNLSENDPNDHSTTVSDTEEETDCEQTIRPFAPEPRPASPSPPLPARSSVLKPPHETKRGPSRSPSPAPPPHSSSPFPPPHFASPPRLPLPPVPAAVTEDENFVEWPWQQIERNMIKKFFTDRNIEIVALVEGQDSATGGVVQARHSYKLEDILWNTSFIPCVLQDELDGTPVIDFSLFHETELTYHEEEEEGEEEERDLREVIDQKMTSIPSSDKNTIRKRNYQTLGDFSTNV